MTLVSNPTESFQYYLLLLLLFTPVSVGDFTSAKLLPTSTTFTLGFDFKTPTPSEFRRKKDVSSVTQSSTSYFQETDHRSTSTASTGLTTGTSQKEVTTTDYLQKKHVRKHNMTTDDVFRGWRVTRTEPANLFNFTSQPPTVNSVSLMLT